MMIRSLRMIMASLLLAGCACGPLSAAFKDAGWGVRALGMGGAFTAVSDDANAILFNPAGLAQAGYPEITFMSARLFTGLDGVDLGTNYLGGMYPARAGIGTFGAAWSSLSSAYLYREDTGSIAWGRWLNDILGMRDAPDAVSIAGGLSLKYLRHEFNLDKRTYNDPVFANGTVSGALTADLGLLVVAPRCGLSAAVAGKNITRPNIGLATADIVPSEVVLGAAYRAERLRWIGLPSFTMAVDLVNRAAVTDLRVGAETVLFKDALALRLGGRPQEISAGVGYRFVLRGLNLGVDYSFGLPLAIERSSGSHRMSLSLRFP